MTPLFLNQLVAISIRLTVPCVGAWIADCDVDLDASGVAPTGKAIVTIGTNELFGTIDPRASGKYGPHARIRVIGGGAGWDKIVTPLPFHNDAQVMSPLVIEATAIEVGEVAIVAVPAALGVDYVRPAGSASSVFNGAPWYVDFSGITQVAPRLPFPQNPVIHEVMSWDPTTKSATIATDDVLKPGMVLVDPRFLTATILDVEQTFSAEKGATATAWCGDLPTSLTTTQSRLLSALASIARDASGAAKLRRYQCRILLQLPDGRLTLQPVSAKSSMPPEVNAFPPWYGVPGVDAKIAPGTLCDVQFDDQGLPRVVSFDGAPVLQLSLGEGANLVSLGGGAAFVAIAELVMANFASLKTWIDLHTHTCVAPASQSSTPSAGVGIPNLSPSPDPVAAEIVKAS